MEPRARTRLRRAGTLAALTALLVPATAGAATAHAAKKSPAPVITSISPRTLAIGETLTIRGHHFKRGRLKNTVAFKRTGGAAVFVKADKSTTKMLKVTLPARLHKALLVRDGQSVATRLRLRVLAARFGKAFSTGKRAPMVLPAAPAGTPAKPSESKPDGDCDGDGVLNKNDGDDDNDLLTDGVELKYGLDPCKADTDGDGVTDGYEMRSAQDLNDDDYQSAPNTWVPYPGKRPYPNPLDGKDAGKDFDGDSLTLHEEFDLWRFTVRYEGAPADLNRLTYSDGEQYSLSVRGANGRRVPSMPVGAYTKHQQFVSWLNAHGYRTATFKVRPTTLWDDTTVALSAQAFGIFDVDLNGETPDEVAGTSDLDGDGYISDDERDEDADGLSNYDESHGRMLPGYWTTCYNQEVPFGIDYAGTSLVDPDSDGDGIPDGADDQDHDDIPNVMELSRSASSHLYDAKNGIPCKEPDVPAGAPTPVQLHSNRYGRVNPFNPCLPATWSRTCTMHPDISGGSAPFDESANWYSLN
jgi:hypothetical protein